MSISTTSAGLRAKASRAASPVSASSMTQPSSSRASFTAVRMRSSSSTDRMRVPIRRHHRRPDGSGGACLPGVVAVVVAVVGVVVEGGEQRVVAGAGRAAVVQPVGEHPAEAAGPAQRRGRPPGSSPSTAEEVDVDPVGPAVDLVLQGGEELDAGVGVEPPLQGDRDQASDDGSTGRRADRPWATWVDTLPRATPNPAPRSVAIA